MKPTPLVSIIIAHYNLADYISEAIGSCLHQTYKNIEIIVIDDCSNDKAALKKIYGLRKKYPEVKLMKNIVNKGSAKTYNIAIEKAKGEYVCCLDADDKFKKTFVEKALKCLLRDPKIGFATSWMRIFGNSNSIEKTPPFDVLALLIRNLFSSASMFTKEAWTKVGGFDPEMKTYRDWDFWISLVERGYRWEVVEEPLIWYRDRKRSASKLSNEKNLFFIKKILQKHEALYKKHVKEVVVQLYEMVIQLNMDVKNMNSLNDTLNTVINTRGWKLLEKLRSLRDKLFVRKI